VTSYTRVAYLKRCVALFWNREYFHWRSSLSRSRVMAGQRF